MIKEDLEAKVLEMTTGLAFKVLPRVVIKLCFLRGKYQKETLLDFFFNWNYFL